MTAADSTERLRLLCAEVGFDLSGVAPAVVARLRLLAQLTETIADCERMVARAHELLRQHQVSDPAGAFSESERRIVVLGTIFADIGKTGPAHADEPGQRLIVEMFAVEGVRDDQQQVSQFLHERFPRDAAERVERFAALGLDPSMTLRQFWNQHSAWTLQILQDSGVPPEVIAAAATHHLVDDINPESIVGADRRFTRGFGENVAFDRAEKLIILLDKYDALRRRGQRSHDEAIAWLGERIASNPSFSDDAELLALLADLNQLGPA